MPVNARWRSRLRKLREDPVSFWAEFPLAPISQIALTLMATYARIALGRPAVLTRRRFLHAIGPGSPGLYRVEGCEARPSRLSFALSMSGAACIYDNDGALLAGALIQPGEPAVLPHLSRTATVRLLRVGGAAPPAVIALAPVSRSAVYRMHRRAGADRLSALRTAWPSTRRARAQITDAEYRRWLSRLPKAEPFASPLSFSVLMPVRDPAPRHLQDAIASVQAQTHANWELIIVDDGSCDPEIARLLSALDQHDPRIRIASHAAPMGVAVATNRALKLCGGDVAVFMDHDDALAPELLSALARAFADSTISAVYTDEDRLDENGNRSEPMLKGALDPERLLSHNYVNHALAVRTSLLRDLGGLRAGYEGAQDHDLLLRLVAKVGASGMRHVSGILYHWRSYPGLNSLSQTRSADAADARRRAVEDHLHGTDAKVLAGPQNRVIWPLGKPPTVRVIVPTRDNVAHLPACVRSLLALTAYPRLQITIVDNGSKDQAALAALSALSTHAAIKVIRCDEPFNFSRLVNLAAAGDGEILALLNDDVVATGAGWLWEMVSLAVRPDVGAVGAKLIYPDGRLQHGGLVLGLGNLGVAGHELRGAPGWDSGPQHRLRVVRQVSAVTAACLVVSRDKFLRAGGFNEALAVGFNDVDFCLRLQLAGLRNLWTPHAQLIHWESISRGSDKTAAGAARLDAEARRMRDLWAEALAADLFYHPWLSRDGEGFALAPTARIKA